MVEVELVRVRMGFEAKISLMLVLVECIGWECLDMD
jgi:hypothetical protein